MLLNGKVVIVSGVGPGMGRHLAVHTTREGARGLVITARSQESLDSTLAAIKEAGTDTPVLALINDIRDLSGCEAVAAAAVKRFDAIDSLINNANVGAGGGGGKASEGDIEIWKHPFEGNCLGTMKMCRAVLPQMKKQKKGFIVNVNTMGTKMRPFADETSYDASKAALLCATRSLAYEVGQFGIHVNSVLPGSMRGPSTEGWVKSLVGKRSEEEIWQRVSKQTAMRRVPTDEEVALAALFLASDYARACTGAQLDANGGAYLP